MKKSGGSIIKKAFSGKTLGLVLLAILMVASFGIGGKGFISTTLQKWFAAGEKPYIYKDRQPNRDGTYKISLDVKGESEKQVPKVNVIVIVDRSGSMGEGSGTSGIHYTATNSNDTGLYGLVNGEYVPLIRHGGAGNRTFWYDDNGTEVRYTGQRYRRSDGSMTRMQATQKAVKNLSDTLLANNSVEGNPDDTVEMALVSFATTAGTNIIKTNDPAEFNQALLGLNANGGTNWEDALDEANGINFGDNDPTYVIFFSDGSPTFHSSDGGYGNWNQGYGVYGTGGETEPNMERSYTQATDDASTLAAKVGADKFYTIFAYGTTVGAGYMSDLTTAAGAPAGNNYSASNTAELEDAFAEILENIQLAGIADAVISDGTTNEVKVGSQIVELLEVDESSYKYYKTNESGDFVKWDKPESEPKLQAKLVNGAVVWDLKEEGVLENGVTYRVTFDVYPSQTTYDYIADLENGVIEYGDLPTEVRQYLHQNGNAIDGYTYSLDTNTENVTLTYDDTRDEAGPQTIDFNKLPSVNTIADSISISKDWDNTIDSHDKAPVDVRLLKNDGTGYEEFCFTDTCKATLNNTNNYSLDDISIATGLARLNGNTLQVLDAGHDYKFDELGSEAYYWQLETEVVHPMLINGSLKKLLLVEENIPDLGGDTYKEIDGKKYYDLGNGNIYVESTEATSIKAKNHRRSNLNITKIVDGPTADPEDEFTFDIDVVQKDDEGNMIPSEDNVKYNDWLWFSVQDADGNYVTLEETPDNWTLDGGSYRAVNGTSLTVKLKAGYNLRFFNLHTGSTFDITETDLDDYTLVKLDEKVKYKEEVNGVLVDRTANPQTVTNSDTISGTITENNRTYTIEATNRYEKVNIDVKKEWSGDNDGAEGLRSEVKFKLMNGSTVVDTVTLDGKTDSVETTAWEGSFKPQPRFSGGREINYTVQEELGELANHYTSEQSGDPKDGLVTVTNTRIPEDTVTKASVFKVWDDDRNHDGFRPTSLQVQLNDEDETIVTLNSGNEWKATVENLPKYANGQEVTYTWTELNLPSQYTQQTPVVTNIEEDGKVVGKLTTITNKHESVYINIPVEKVWLKDDNGSEGLRTAVTVKLLKGTETIGTKTLNSANSWKGVFEHVAKYEDGEEIEYDLEEVKVDHYTTDISFDEKTGTFTVTNTREDDKTIEIPVEKIWVGDNNDEQGLRTPITVTLKNGNTTVGTKTLSASNNWKDKFTDLPKYENGAEIEYTLTENYTNTHYEIGEVEGSTKEGFTVTNTRIPDDITIKYTVKKIWDDSDDQDGIRPDSITVTLTGTIKERDNNGNLTDTDKVAYPAEEVTVSKPEGAATNEWSVTVENLPKYADGQLITYTISEEQVDDYDKPEIDGNEVTNPHNPFETKVTVIKKWDDKNDQDGLRDEVTFMLTNDKGLLIPGAHKDVTFKLTDENVDSEGNWVTSKEGLPRRSAGEEIEYSVVEISRPAGYTAKDGDPKVEKSKTDDKSGAQEFTITYTNVHETATVDVEGVKEWNDDSNRDVVRPQSIYVTLTGTVDGEVVKTETKIVTSATAVEGNPNQWAYSFTGLDEFYNGGKTITYTITETDENGNEINNLPNYNAPEYFGDYSVRNTHTNEPTSLSGKKVWEDDGNRDAVRPATITIEVYDVDDPNTIVDSKEVTGSMTGAEWSYEFTGLPANKNVNGTKTPITYEVKEVNVPDGYTSKVEEDGTTITNTYTPEKTQISGKKVWVDDGNRDALRPTTITVEVYDVDDPNTVVASKEVSGDMTADDWSYTITGLPANKNVNGKATPITYKVKEVSLPTGYTSKVEDDGTTITNTHETAKINVPVSKTWIDSDDKEKHRPTEITVYLYDDKDVKVGETKLNAENGWEYTFENLPANRNVNGVATPITYRAEEVITDQIREFYDVDVVENTAIINTIKDLSKDIPVAKIWNDANNQDGKRKPVTITLSGTITDKDENVINVETDKVPKTITLTEEDLDPNDPNRWVGVFENVPIFYQGSWITYQITEAEVADYSVTAYGTEDDGTLTVTNTHEPEQAVYSASKVWNDDDDNDDRRPDSVTFALMAGENEVQRLVASEENGWKVTFDAVPVYKEGAVGQKITYTVTEPELDSNYTMSEDIATGETEYDFIITNDHEPMTITYNVQKIWDDWDNQSGDRPESITVRIYESTDLENEVASKVITEASGWSCTFDGLPKYRNKQLIQYVITEDNVDLYKEPIITQVEQERDTTELNNTVTNPKDRVPYNDTGEITVNKYWKDEENKYKKRPKSVTIELLADGEVIATADLTEANEWTYTFTGLWKYKEGEVGVEIVYSIRELAVEYYKTTIDGFDVYNTYDGPVPEITPPNTGVMMVQQDNNSVLFEMIVTALATSYTIVVARRANEQ